jgi:tubulin polyglutamylase TTLL6/13
VLFYFISKLINLLGLARFCTKKYEKTINLDNIDEIYMHLTNYAVNKHNTEFVRNEDSKADDKGLL